LIIESKNLRAHSNERDLNRKQNTRRIAIGIHCIAWLLDTKKDLDMGQILAGYAIYLDQ